MHNFEKRSRCPQCGKEFRCGIAVGEPTCWCFDHPHLIRIEDAKECLCPDCLKGKISKKQEKNIRID
ncbi:MAG: cysteine-rich CWC family protein [Bacteroidota bacterium]